MLGVALSTPAREAALDRLERESFDCVVIGGGISGAGIAREAAQRGLAVALLEAEDFASGTSSRSSKLVHGGLRYLAQAEFRLVRKAALERKVIHQVAPHLAQPRWMIVPSRSWTTHLKVRTGIAAYEKLGAVEGEDLHPGWSREELALQEPGLDLEALKYATVYREYLTDDAHLVLANLRSAGALGTVSLNHAPVDAILREGDIAVGVEAVCRFTGRRVRVRARCVINAAGPWVEPIRRLEDPSAPSLLHLSKGVHIVIPAERLPVKNMVICFKDDGRLIFVIRRDQCVYIGTTDTSYPGGPQIWPEITREDVEYLLEAVNDHFRTEPVRPEEVTAAWAGLRPLVAEPGKPPGEISRRDEVLVGPARVITVAGGKLTGYRLMAEETVEKAAEVCGLRLAPDPGEEPLLPGGDFHGDLERLAGELVTEFGIARDCAARLARLHGSEARQVARIGTEPLLPGAPILASEVDWAVEHEAACSVEDVLYRRMCSVWYVPGAREDTVEPVAERMAALLGWDAVRTRKEVSECKARLAYELSFLARSAA